MTRPPAVWIHWLSAVCVGVIAFGLVMVLAPGLARQGFSMLLYAEPDRIHTFGAEPARYVGLAHAVIGGVMIGWGLLLLGITRTLLARGDPLGWTFVVLSVVGWYLPDTAHSLAAGYWQNVVLNSVFLALFAWPLWRLRRHRPVDAEPR